MKIKNIKIGVSNTQQILDNFVETGEAIERGESPEKSEGVYFESIDTLESILTDKRLTLLRTIKEKKPQSIYELAKILHRDTKNVSNDVAKLSELGFITLTKSKKGRARVSPAVNYDKIVLEIPISRLGVKGYSLWENVQGRGSRTGVPHLGTHTWPEINKSVLTIVDDDLVDNLLDKVRKIDNINKEVGIRAFVWDILKTV